MIFYGLEMFAKIRAAMYNDIRITNGSTCVVIVVQMAKPGIKDPGPVIFLGLTTVSAPL